MEILRVENLSKVYGKGKNKVVAVDDMNFSVEKGEFVAIVGRSGGGKSTLLHLIGGVDEASNGNIFIDNTKVSNLSKDKMAVFRRRNIGIIYQFYNLIPILSVKENITLPLLLDNKTIDEKLLDDTIKYVGLERRVNHLPNELSGGEQQRVSIARAIITKPLLILADEPTGNLDTKRSKEIMDLLKKYNKEYNQTIILITHDLNVAKEADRIITIEDGKIIKDEVDK
ncbi:MAG: ABC transporter ATP-binding protein [Clostridiales bacterium]|nr:ABC transporter ATP-binding protein [Clostridiales bacterium]